MNTEKNEDLFKSLFKDIIKTIKGYVKGQLITIVITIIILTGGLWYLKIPKAIIIALAISLFDIIPVIGSGLIMLPWASVLLFTGNKELATGIAVLYIITTLTRQILEPVIIGKQIGLSPLTTFLSVIVAVIVLGPLGVIIGPLAGAILISLMKYRKKSKND